MKIHPSLTVSQADRLLCLDDSSLIALYAQTSNQEYLEELVHRYVPFIKRICNRYFPLREDAEDMCMRVLEVFLANLENADKGRFAAWLRAICLNECLMELRAQRRMRYRIRPESYLEFKRPLETSSAPAQVHYSARKPSWVLLNRELKGLPRPQRDCLELYYYQEYSYREICEEKGMTYNQVKSYMQNGRRNLRRRLKKHPCFSHMKTPQSGGSANHG